MIRNMEGLAGIGKQFKKVKPPGTAYKPDSVSPLRTTAIIYLRRPSLNASICLPSVIGRAALKRPYTWHFSTQGLPAITITRYRRGPLPHIFTLTLAGGHFLWHYLSPQRSSHLLGGALPCAVRTFLPFVSKKPIARLYRVVLPNGKCS